MNHLMLFGFCLFFSQNIFAEILLQNKKINSHYTATIQFDNDLVYGTLNIKKDNKLVYKQSGFDYHYFWGLSEDSADAYSRKYLTVSKIPILVVTNWTGGANCCYLLSLFELGKNFRKLIEIDAMSTQYELRDLDGDGVAEIEFWDGSIRGVFTSTSETAYGRVVMKYIDGNYKVYPNLMRRAKPRLKQITKMRTEMVNSFRDNIGDNLPHDYLKHMMNLSYSGHLNLALKIAEETWPHGRKRFNKFKKDFITCLNESSYWKEFSRAR